MGRISRLDRVVRAVAGGDSVPQFSLFSAGVGHVQVVHVMIVHDLSGFRISFHLLWSQTGCGASN